jgi:hypothetical protein
MTAIRLASFALALLLAAPPAFAQTQTPIVADFENPRWQEYFTSIEGFLKGRLEDGKLVVESTRPPGSSSTAHWGLAAEGPMSVFVDVTATFDGPTSGPDGDPLLVGPGLVIRTEMGVKSYYALLLQADGYLVLAVADRTVRQTLSGSIEPDALTRPVRLAAREAADGGAEFFVNGERVATLADSAVKGDRGGLTVWGAGTFTFDNFGHTTTGDIGDGRPNAPGPKGPAPVGGPNAPPPLPGTQPSPNAPTASPNAPAASPNAPAASPNALPPASPNAAPAASPDAAGPAPVAPPPF